jgi:hypothetical protein
MSDQVSDSDRAGWWRRKPGESVHADLIPYTSWLLGAYRRSHQFARACEAIYQGDTLRGYGLGIAQLRATGFDTARLNVAKPVADTVVARLSKRRPMPQFKVDNADWSLKRKAKRYRQFIVGEMMESDFETLSPMALRDGTIEGNGITHIDDGEDDILAERVYRDELLVDPRETKYGKPWQVQRVMRVARDWLLDCYPKHKDAIRSAPPSLRRPNESMDEPDLQQQSSSLEGYVDVTIAHRRPTSHDSDDGRMAVVIDGATLRFEEWDSPRFPYAVFRFSDPLRGFWGRGLIRDLADIQHRINCIVRDVQLNIEAVGKGSYLVNEAFDIPVEMMTGARPYKYMYRGPQPPQWNAPAPVSGQTLQLLEFFIRQAYELTGVSQAQASSKSSLGLGASGVALDTQYDIESERFAMVERQYTRYRLDAAQLYLDAACRVAKKRDAAKGSKKDKAYVTSWRGRDKIERLEYSEVEMDADQYRLEMEPVSFVPDTRAGKLSAAQELTQAGIIPQWLAASLFDEPDLAKAQMFNLAAYWNQERIMEQLGDPDADMLVPEPHHDLEIALKMAVAYVNYAESEGAPEEVVSRYRQYADLVVEAKKPPDVPADPMAAAMGGMPMDPMAGAPPMPGGPMPPMGAPPGMPPGAPPPPPDLGGLPMPVAA